MSTLVPNRFLFRFELPVYRWRGAARLDGDLSKWPARHQLPPLHTIDGQPGFGDVYLAWSDDGVLVAAQVRGKRTTAHCDPAHFRQSDHVRLMTDMRDARDIRRATRFCQQFYFLPTGGGRGQRQPVAGAAPVARAKENAPLPEPGAIPIASRLTPDGWAIEAQIPARVLVGFDPSVNARIGFLAMLEDRELGHQSLTVDDDLNWWCDPSTWVTGVLSD
ncbi:MAG: hypothetical protein L6Q92_13755 [Phycisphaerae bacterium]|nr:hypothetical protein [Phycisphaerae bacterium]